MNRPVALRFGTLLISGLAPFAACTEQRADSFRDVAFVASTPCQDAIKRLLSIPKETKCDFVRWDLRLALGQAKTFNLDINFGEGQPNTPGFWGGGQKLALTGTFDTVKNIASSREIYRLKSSRPTTQISMLKVNENLFHLLTDDGTLMVGTTGWSYTLSRKEPVANASQPGFTLNSSGDGQSDSVTYAGRTPCRGLSALRGISTAPSCARLKWRLTLSRDPATHQPTSYSLKGTIFRDMSVSGTWKIEKGTAGNSESIIYRLDPDRPGPSLSFLVAEDKLLFFLDASGRLLTGNADFSYTLNRKLD